jgi:TonB family protein
MNNPYPRIIQRLAIIASAAVITVALFVAIPIIHGMFGFSLDVPGGLKQRPQIPVENLPPPKKESAKIEGRLRQVKSQAMDKALAGSERAMAMKFTPDLSVAGSANGAAIGMQGQELQVEVFEEGQTDENPVPLYTPPVEYPERARELGIQGIVEVNFIIGTNGNVESINITKSPHPTLSAEARKTIAQWRFKPGRNKGVPVRVRAKKPIEFKLE